MPEQLSSGFKFKHSRRILEILRLIRKFNLFFGICLPPCMAWLFCLYFFFAICVFLYNIRNMKAYDFFPAFISVFHNTFLSAFHVPFGREMTQGIVLITSPSNHPMQKPHSEQLELLFIFFHSRWW